MSDSITQNFARVNPDGSVTFDFGVIANQPVQFPFGISIGGISNVPRIGGAEADWVITFGAVDFDFSAQSTRNTSVQHFLGVEPEVAFGVCTDANVNVSPTSKNAGFVAFQGDTLDKLAYSATIDLYWLAIGQL